MKRYVDLLKDSIKGLLTDEKHELMMPKTFEYFVALKLSKFYQTQFYGWADIDPLKKKQLNLPLNDKGVDCCTEDFKRLVQIKYYNDTSVVNYSSLATFLAFPQFFNKKEYA